MPIPPISEAARRKIAKILLAEAKKPGRSPMKPLLESKPCERCGTAFEASARDGAVLLGSFLSGC
jgi:hypothetical protein